jgi:hypothetical protein
MNVQPILELVVNKNGFGFRSDTGEIFRLNVTACQVLGWMRDCADEDAIVHRLAATYDVPAPRARSDVSTFLEHLQTLHLLEPHEA